MLFLVSAVLPFETTDLPNDEEEEIDPFAELEIGTNSPRQTGRDALAMFEEDDPLSALTDDGAEQKEDFVISFEADGAPELKNGLAKTVNSSEATYKLLLETVWVDDILDPSEVELLARKRDELGLTFERHLQLVREIIGG
tara:strand:+ start:3318 stop:3740 length:423 start_codon:yes stop_codon:yes gene_type:complete